MPGSHLLLKLTYSLSSFTSANNTNYQPLCKILVLEEPYLMVAAAWLSLDQSWWEKGLSSR